MRRLDFLLGGGEMGERIRAFGWAHHPLGPAQTWPQSLKSAVSICLGSRFPILICRMHGGSIEVESEPGRGALFRVTIPFGSEHLPAERVHASRDARLPTTAGAYVEEALRWLPTTAGADEPTAAPPGTSAPLASDKARILLVDDNADMREYVRGSSQMAGTS